MTSANCCGSCFRGLPEDPRVPADGRGDAEAGQEQGGDAGRWDGRGHRLQALVRVPLLGVVRELHAERWLDQGCQEEKVEGRGPDRDGLVHVLSHVQL